MVSVKRKIVRNTIANYAIRFWQLSIGLILLPFIVYHIGIVAYGIFALVGAVTGYFGLLDLGVSPALIKYVAEYRAKEDNRKINETINTAFFFFLGMGIISCISFFLFGKYVIQYFDMPSEYVLIAQVVMYFTAISTLFGFSLRAFGGVISGLQRYDLSAYIGFISSIVNVVVTVTVLLMGGGLIELVFYSMVFASVSTLLTVYYVKRLLPFLSIKWSYVTKGTMRTVFRFSGVMFLIAVCGVIIYQTDQIIIGAFLTVGAITFYTVAAKLHSVVRQVHGLMGSAIMPAASELDALRRKDALRRLFLKGSKYTAAIVLPLTISILILAEPFIIYWMGEEFRSMALVAQVFVVYWLLNGVGGLSGAILIGIDKIRFLLWYTISIAMVNLILSIILVQKFGVFGVVLGTTIPYVGGYFIGMSYTLKVIGMHWKTFFKEVSLKVYPFIGIVAVFLYFTVILHYPQNLVEVGIYGLFTLGVYLGLFYKFSLDDSEKSMIKKQINKYRVIFAHNRQVR